MASSFQWQRIDRRGYNRAPLETVVDALRRGEQLPKVRRDHPLKGIWKGWRECQVQPDWLLIYKTTDVEVLLSRTHTDPFDS